MQSLKSVYLAPPDYLLPTLEEIPGTPDVYDRLVLSENEVVESSWAQNIWLNPVVHTIESINDAAKKLKAIQRNWVFYSYQLHRRTQLIQDKLPKIAFKPHIFPSPIPASPLGSWALIDKNTMIASSKTLSAFPNGEVIFAEDKENPPSRAYLKLWEAFTIWNIYPKEGERCLDAGSSPGGWSWVLANCGADVISVDRSPINESLLRHPRIIFKKQNAFTIKPDECDHLDWVFSDVICYPEKLLDWVSSWVESGKTNKILCTIKFKGDSKDYSILDAFKSLRNCRMKRLYNNKHEMTWFWEKP